MRLPIFQILAAATTVGDWAIKALADGKVEVREGFELVERLAGVIGVPLAFDVSDHLAPAPVEIQTDEPTEVAAEEETVRFHVKPEE